MSSEKKGQEMNRTNMIETGKIQTGDRNKKRYRIQAEKKEAIIISYLTLS